VTSSLIRGRPRRATSHISARVAHTLLGVLIGVLWLVLPGMTIEHRAPAADGRAQAAAPSAAPEADESSAADLVLPLVVAGAAVVVAGYAYVRRSRRTRTRTTPGGAPAPLAASPPPAELDEQARVLLVAADDSVRTSREELAFVEARFGESAVASTALALRGAEAELRAAFRMRQQYDDGVPEEAAARQHTLAGIVGRCEEAGRRLDEAAAGVDQLRGLEQGAGEALGLAETRFRALTGRTQAVDALLADLTARYGPAAVAEVTGYGEQAKDRLVFATLRLNQARQAGDLAAHDRAALHLRAAEGAIAQAAVFLHGVERLGTELSAAAALVPAALTGAEAEIARAQRSARARVPVGELRARIVHADNVLAFVRDEVTRGAPHDPLDAVRRIVRAVAPLAAEPTAGVLGAAAALAARAAVAGADDFVATHRGAVGATARTRLAEAVRLLGEDPVAADALAVEARDLAEQDVRVHGNPVAGAAGHESGGAGAVLGGILLDDGAAASFGGPRGRGRRGASSEG